MEDRGGESFSGVRRKLLTTNSAVRPRSTLLRVNGLNKPAGQSLCFLMSGFCKFLTLKLYDQRVPTWYLTIIKWCFVLIIKNAGRRVIRHLLKINLSKSGHFSIMRNRTRSRRRLIGTQSDLRASNDAAPCDGREASLMKTTTHLAGFALCGLIRCPTAPRFLMERMYLFAPLLLLFSSCWGFFYIAVKKEPRFFGGQVSSAGRCTARKKPLQSDLSFHRRLI